MKGQLDHVAFITTEYDWYTAFFREVFEMESYREDGQAPARKIWFHEGIQINEAEQEVELGKRYDHISLVVEDIPKAIAACLEHGCKPMAKGAHWCELPNGLKLELKPKGYHDR